MRRPQKIEKGGVIIPRPYLTPPGLTARYSFLHSFYWPVLCCSFSFGTVFFLSKGYSNGETGAILAAASILSVLAQPAAAVLADRSERISMKQLIVILSAAGAALAAVRFFCSNVPAVPAVLFVLEQAIVGALQPLMNALGVQVMNRGGKINFGLSRGTGSMTYAVVSILLGLFLRTAKTDVLPLFSIAFYVAFAVSVIKFPAQRHCETKKATPPEGPHGGGHASRTKADVRFLLLLVAVALAFCSQSMIGSFMINIVKHVGGTAENVGITNGISAAIEMPAMTMFALLIKKYRSGTLLKVSFAVFVCKALATMLAPSVAALYLVQALQFGAYALFIPASVYYANEVIPESSLAKGQAALTTAATFGGVAANLLGGWILDGFGVGAMLAVSVLSAVVGCAVGLPVIRRGREFQTEENKT